MSLSNATENQVLKMLLQGTDPSYRAGTTQYVALVSAASPDEASPMTTELTYTGYARVALPKATAWTDGGSSFTNAVQVLFGKRTDAGATQQARNAVICDTASGAITMGIIAPLSDTLDIALNIQPIFSPGDITIEAQ
ncbi:MAG: phage tail fiber protein [Beijerinckiaceae bacterium]